MTRPPPNSLLLAAVVWCCFLRFCIPQGSGPCQISDKCGQFGVCDSRDSPICSCLPGFLPRISEQWSSGNWSGGCSRRRPLSCNAAAREKDGFLKLQIVMLFDYSERWSGHQSQCGTRCLANCSCVAYASDGGDGCRFWAGPLANIQKFPSGSGSIIFVRVSNSELDVKKLSNKIVVTLVVAAAVVVCVGAFLCWRLIDKHRGKKETIEMGNVVDLSLPDGLSQVNIDELPLFTLAMLTNATGSFSEANRLGKGGFGPVYKGELGDGREVAVKRLSQASTQGMQEFINEVVLISKLQHKNLVRLLGCCVESKETMLVYEYMPNKSLDHHLFDSSQEILDWTKRYKIIEGVCRGLVYLHRDSRLKIIHRDLKPSNILLDNDWNPKISDFGMARIFGAKQDHVSTVRVVGTYGYMAPEYAMEGRFSEKSDVYSLGVLMVEIATGRRNKTAYQDGSLSLLGHVWKLWNADNVGGVIDRRISGSKERVEVMRCIHIGLLCVEASPSDRPSVSAVLSMLRSEVIELTDPKQPALSVRPVLFDSTQEIQICSSSSANNVSLTIVDGR
ncbi:non-specific serine/threonine protein kinase [Salvia divinorum]|uniref:non-specific serine/threonine protein kinase n=1 Tax=Salvia divinorum TaxID=28513 RepID=A0ABD1G014_SALDI